MRKITAFLIATRNWPQGCHFLSCLSCLSFCVIICVRLMAVGGIQFPNGFAWSRAELGHKVVIFVICVSFFFAIHLNGLANVAKDDPKHDEELATRGARTSIFWAHFGPYARTCTHTHACTHPPLNTPMQLKRRKYAPSRGRRMGGAPEISK